jgi:hypothetical protein
MPNDVYRGTDAWTPYADADIYGSLTTSGAVDRTDCNAPSGSSGCTSPESVARFPGPDVIMYGDCFVYPPNGGTYGPADERSLRCVTTLTVAPTRPLGSFTINNKIDIDVPSAGSLILKPGSSGSHAHTASARPPARPVFTATTIRVASARPVSFTPKLSANAERLFKRHHKLAITINMRFVPNGNAKALTRTVTETLTPPVKRPPTCPKHPRGKTAHPNCQPKPNG